MTHLGDPNADLVSMGLSGWHGPPPVMERFHRHNEVELNFVEEGAISYLSGGRQVSVKAGQLAVFWAALPHRLVRAEDPAIFHWLTLPLASFLQWRLPEALTQPVLHGEVVWSRTPQMSRYDQILFGHWQDDLKDGSEAGQHVLLIEVEARLRRLAVSLASSVSRTSPSEVAKPVTDGEGLGKVEGMTRFVAEHYTEPVRVADVAHSVGLHPNYALTLFRRALGIGIVEYVTQHRVLHAQRLLATTDASVLEVALAAGFNFPSRFYTVFRRDFGRTPREYRALVRTP